MASVGASLWTERLPVVVEQRLACEHRVRLYLRRKYIRHCTNKIDLQSHPAGSLGILRADVMGLLANSHTTFIVNSFYLFFTRKIYLS